MLLCFLAPIYQSELLFQIKPNYGLGGENDPYNLFELSPDEGGNHIDNSLILLSSSLLYRKAVDSLFPHATKTEKDSLGVWLDDQINVRQVGNTTMLRITCRSDDPHMAQKLLDYFFRFVQEDSRQDYEVVTNSAVKFLEDRIYLLRNEIKDLDDINADFLIESKTMTPRMAYLSEWNDYAIYINREERLEAELQVRLFLRNYVKETVLEEGFLPSLQMQNQYATTQIQNYNAAWIIYDNLRRESSPDVGVLHDKHRELELLRRAVLVRLESEIGTLRLKLGKVKGRISTGAIGFADASEHLAGSYKNQRFLKSKLNTYVLLSLKLEEIRIKQAIYKSNFKLIEPATFSPFPLRKRNWYVIGFSLFVGLIFPVVFFILFDKLDYSIRKRSELEEYPNIRIFEEIPFAGYQIEAFNRIRADLFYYRAGAKVVFFTSTLPHEGKTYIARNLAMSLSKGGRKVVLVDADIRKATQSKELNLDRKIGVSTYLSGEDNDLDSIITFVEDCPNLSLIPCGTIPPNPSELLVGERWENMIVQLREKYDYVVIDSVPAQLVADAMISARVSDLSFYVLRSGMIDRRFLPELNRFFNKNLFPNMYVLLNGFER